MAITEEDLKGYFFTEIDLELARKYLYVPDISLYFFKEMKFEKIYYDSSLLGFFKINGKNFQSLEGKCELFTDENPSMDCILSLNILGLGYVMEKYQEELRKLPLEEIASVYPQKKNHVLLFFLTINEILRKQFLTNCIDYLQKIEQETKELTESIICRLLLSDLVIYNSTIPFKENTLKDKANSKDNIPYKIALLEEIGFFQLPKVKNLSKVKQREVISKIIGGTDRQLKGNISVLDPNSLESRTRYTSFSYEEEVKRYLSSLNN